MQRIYVVNNKAGGGERLVSAGSRVQAENFVARETIVGRLASQGDLVHLIGVGVVIEDVADPVYECADSIE